MSRLDGIGNEFEVEPIRERTKEEVRALLLKEGWAMLEEWRNMKGKTEAQKMAGFYFSFLAMLDGNSPGVPPFAIIPLASEEGKEFSEDRGENWFPITNDKALNKLVDIGGDLHGEVKDHEPINGPEPTDLDLQRAMNGVIPVQMRGNRLELLNPTTGGRNMPSNDDSSWLDDD